MSNRLQILRERAAFAELLSDVSAHNERIRTLRFRACNDRTIEGEWDRGYAEFLGGQGVRSPLAWGSGSISTGTRWVVARKRSNVCTGFLALARGVPIDKLGTADATLPNRVTNRLDDRDIEKHNLNVQYGKLGGSRVTSAYADELRDALPPEAKVYYKELAEKDPTQQQALLCGQFDEFVKTPLGRLRAYIEAIRRCKVSPAQVAQTVLSNEEKIVLGGMFQRGEISHQFYKMLLG